MVIIKHNVVTNNSIDIKNIIRLGIFVDLPLPLLVVTPPPLLFVKYTFVKISIIIKDIHAIIPIYKSLVNFTYLSSQFKE